MESKLNNKKTGLLPQYYKKIGAIVIASSFIIVVLAGSVNIGMTASHKELLKLFTKNLFILGLLFIAWSRDKAEDEMTFFIRLRVMAWAFITAVFMVIINPILDVILQDKIEIISGSQIVIIMLIAYILMYYFQKRNR